MDLFAEIKIAQSLRGAESTQPAYVCDWVI